MALFSASVVRSVIPIITARYNMITLVRRSDFLGKRLLSTGLHRCSKHHLDRLSSSTYHSRESKEPFSRNGIFLMFGPAASAFNRLPAFRGKQRLYRAIFSWLPFRSCRSFYGVRMQKNMSDSTYRASMVGSYGTLLSRLLQEQREPFAFLDVGANQGLYSLLACENSRCVTAVSVEPNPYIFAYLVGNAALNPAARTKLLAVCAALSDSAGEVLSLAYSKRHSGAASLYGDTAGTETVRVISLDGAALNRMFADADVPLFVKIDVEGAEVLVLQQLAEAGLMDKATSLVIEINERYRHTASIREFLGRHGWIERQREGTDSLYDAHYRKPSNSPRPARERSPIARSRHELQTGAAIE